MLMRICCFIGHRKIKITEVLIDELKRVIEYLIVKMDVQVFLFGSKSDFNDLCHKIVCNLKEKFHYVKLIYIRAEYPFINKEYTEYLLKNYDETYFPEKIINAGKSRYVERNYYIIDKSDFCIFYYDKEYAPPNRKFTKKFLVEHESKSGTKLAYDYAVKKKKNIINITERL